MTEDKARAWFRARWPERVGAVEELILAVANENGRQNLVAASTLEQSWSRHVVDSAQLALLVPASERVWIDIGTGGGFPGAVCALVRPEQFIFVEPRRRRAEFLCNLMDQLGLRERVEVKTARIEQIASIAGTLSARAVAPISTLLNLATACIDRGTYCVFPRGRVDWDDVNVARSNRHMMFHVEHSVTDASSEIALISGIAPL